jgi:hypothetical protein
LHDTSLLAGFADFDQLSAQARQVLVVTETELEELSMWQVVSGHFRLSTLLRVAPSSAVCTVLREPRTRTLSMYQYGWLNTWEREFWRPWDIFDHFRVSLEKFLADPSIAANVDNVLCRLLIDDDSLIPAEGFISPEDVEEVASLAVNQLETLGFVGTVELGNVWHGLSALFGAELEPVRTNVTGEGGSGGSREALATTVEVTDRTLQLLHERTASDAIVYAHVLRSAGLSTNEARTLSDTAFAQQLVKLGDLMGTSALETARTAADHEETLRARDSEIEGLREVVRAKDDELAIHRRWEADVQKSLSWRSTAWLRAARQILREQRTGGSV